MPVHAQKGRRVRARASRCRGVTLIYVLVAFAALSGLCSLAVDLGHAEVVKMELTRACDATAHDYMQLYSTGGKTSANSLGPQTYSSSDNPVDDGVGIQPTVTATWGYWNTATNTFSTTAVTTAIAVKVTMSRTNANGNAVPIMFGSLLGVGGINITVSAVAALVPGASTTVSVSSLSDPYFAGSPSTITDAAGDTMSTDAPTQVSGIPVTPGQFITFTNVSGTTSVVPGEVPYVGPAGQTQSQYGSATQHNENWDGTYPYNSGGSENGIANAIMPEDAFMGLFLGTTLNTSSAPATVDWTQASQLNQADYENIQLQQPFYVGTGSTNASTPVVQKFLVPTGAKYLYVGIWDGVQYSNNGGSLTATISQAPTIEIVQ